VRPARPDEVPFEEAMPLLRDPEDGNVVPGPGTLRAVVRSDKDHHPFVYIEDTAVGTSRRLLDRPLSMPRWSPDGRMIACVAWESRRRPNVLTVVDMATGEATQPEFPGSVAATYTLSPDSRWIALAGHLETSLVLALVSLPSGSTRVLDSLDVLADYDFGWSPDSRWLAVLRPTRVDHYGETLSAELLVFDLLGSRCLLSRASDLYEAPRWLDPSRLSYAPRPTSTDPTPARMVLELAPDAAPRR
jgi:hypothetical protein